MVRLRARNALDGSVWPGFTFRCARNAEVQIARGDGDGRILLDPTGAWTLSSEDPDVRLLVPAKAYLPEEGEQDVWLYRFKLVRGHVTLEKPEGVATEGILVAVRPAGHGTAPKEVALVGTAQWCEDLMLGERLPWQVRANEGRYEIDVPVLRDMSIIASARGHISQTRPLALADAAISGRDINFHLRAGESIQITVKDPEGNTLSNVPVQFVSTFKVPTAQLNMEELRLRKRASNVGFGTVGNDATGMTTVGFNASSRTDDAGTVGLSQTASEGKLVLMIHESGYEPFVAILSSPGEYMNRDIGMKRIVPVRDGYRLCWKGKYVSEGAGLQLCEMVEDLTLALRPMKAGRNGVFAGSLIPAGKKYYALLFDPGEIGSKSGVIQFGSDETVDISAFE